MLDLRKATHRQVLDLGQRVRQVGGKVDVVTFHLQNFCLTIF